MLLGQVPAGVRTTDMDQSGNFLNIPRKGQGDLNLSARKEHDVLGYSSAQQYQINRMNQSMQFGATSGSNNLLN